MPTRCRKVSLLWAKFFMVSNLSLSLSDSANRLAATAGIGNCVGVGLPAAPPAGGRRFVRPGCAALSAGPDRRPARPPAEASEAVAGRSPKGEPPYRRQDNRERSRAEQYQGDVRARGAIGGEDDATRNRWRHCNSVRRQHRADGGRRDRQQPRNPRRRQNRHRQGQQQRLSQTVSGDGVKSAHPRQHDHRHPGKPRPGYDRRPERPHARASDPFRKFRHPLPLPRLQCGPASSGSPRSLPP